MMRMRAITTRTAVAATAAGSALRCAAASALPVAPRAAAAASPAASALLLPSLLLQRRWLHAIIPLHSSDKHADPAAGSGVPPSVPADAAATTTDEAPPTERQREEAGEPEKDGEEEEEVIPTEEEEEQTLRDEDEDEAPAPGDEGGVEDEEVLPGSDEINELLGGGDDGAEGPEGGEGGAAVDEDADAEDGADDVADAARQNLRPSELVAHLDRYIVGQFAAKKSVAVALRNRWRRHSVRPTLRQDITPKNILMVGPTGCGKTEIARRLAMITDSPFIKVEATKFTEGQCFSFSVVVAATLSYLCTCWRVAHLSVYLLLLCCLSLCFCCASGFLRQGCGHDHSRSGACGNHKPQSEEARKARQGRRSAGGQLALAGAARNSSAGGTAGQFGHGAHSDGGGRHWTGHGHAKG
jgi:hypothetical protein